MSTPGVCEMSPVKSPEELTARDAGKKDKVVVEMDEAEELPPGWTKELKIRKSGSAKKVDRFYTDPVTGYIFRSLKDAQRYLKTGELGRLAIKPKNNECVDMDNKDERLHMEEREERGELKEQMSESLRRKRPLDMTRSKFNETGVSESLHRASKRLTGINIDSPLPSLPEPEPEPDAELKTRQAKHESGIRDNASLPKAKTRRDTRQAGIKIDSSPPSPPNTRNSRQATRARLVDLATPKEDDIKTEAKKMTDELNENAVMYNDPNDNQEKTIIIPPVNQESNEKHQLHNISPSVTPIEHNKKIEMGHATLLNREDQLPPTVVPLVDSEKQESHVVNNTVWNSIPQDGYGYGGTIKPESSINFSMNGFWTDPCIEFAVKTLTGAIPYGDLIKPENLTPPPLEVPPEVLWTDPCIESAVKTLTGPIPVGEDDYLPPRPASASRNLRPPHDFRLPDVGMSFCQTGVLSKRFETGQNKQQNSTFGNGGLQKSGNFVNG